MRPMKDIGPPVCSVRFGPFLFNTYTGELFHGDLRLKLSGQAIEVLRVLVSRPGQLVTREELQRQLWPGEEFGDFEHGLNAAVNRLRENLFDSAVEPRYVETIPRRGYRFVAELHWCQSEFNEGPAANVEAVAPEVNAVEPGNGGDGNAPLFEVKASNQICPSVPPTRDSRPTTPLVPQETRKPQEELLLVGDTPRTTVDPVVWDGQHDRRSHTHKKTRDWMGSHRKLTITAIVLLVAISGCGIYKYWQLHHRTYRSIAVLYINNLTHDPELNWLPSAITDMLTTNLAQVRGLDVPSTDRVLHSLKRMERNNEALDFAEAQRAARDLGTDAYITGTLLKMGSDQLRLEIRVQDTKTGRIVFSEKEDIEGIDVVLGMVDELTRSLAVKFLPNASTKNEAQIRVATTWSIQAYRHYRLGVDFVHRYLDNEAAQEFQKAIEIDPQFASAYLELANLYSQRREFKKSDALIDKVEQLHLQLPRREQLMLEIVRANRSAAADGVEVAMQKLINEFPGESIERGVLAGMLENSGRFDKAKELLQEGLERNKRDDILLDFQSYVLTMWGDMDGALASNDAYQKVRPSDPNPPQSRGDLMFAFGRDDEAIAAYRKSLEIREDFTDYSSYARLALVYADQRKPIAAKSALDQYSSKTSAVGRSTVPALEAQIAISLGDLEAALVNYRRAVSQLRQAQQYEHAGLVLTNYAKLAVELGRTPEAMEFAKQQNLEGEEQFALAALEMLNGAPTEARERLETLNSVAPWTESPVRLRDDLAFATAWTSVQRGDGSSALAQIALVNHDRRCMYLRARSHLLRKDFAAAEADFLHAIRLQRIFGGIWMAAQRYPLEEILSLYYLGQIYERTGRREQAIQSYSAFLARFQNKPVPLPQVAEAREAMKRLH